eukprot:3120821-Rhodomonas_salina.2
MLRAHVVEPVVTCVKQKQVSTPHDPPDQPTADLRLSDAVDLGSVDLGSPPTTHVACRTLTSHLMPDMAQHRCLRGEQRS